MRFLTVACKVGALWRVYRSPAGSRAGGKLVVCVDTAGGSLAQDPDVGTRRTLVHLMILSGCDKTSKLVGEQPAPQSRA